MTEDQSGTARIMRQQVLDGIQGTTFRRANAPGPSSPHDARLRAQIDLIVGRRLSQFSMSTGGIRLAFWGESLASVDREILIEHSTLEIGRANQAAAIHQWNDDVVATTLLAALDDAVSYLDLTDGYLSIEFSSGLRIRVEPDRLYESWQISSDDHLLIVCTPGGELTIWYPDDQN